MVGRVGEGVLAELEGPEYYSQKGAFSQISASGSCFVRLFDTDSNSCDYLTQLQLGSLVRYAANILVPFIT